VSLGSPGHISELTLAPDVARQVCQHLALSESVAERAIDLASTYGGFGDRHARGSPRTIAAACVWIAVEELGMAASVGRPGRGDDPITQKSLAHAAGIRAASLREARNRIENQGGRS